MNSRPLSTTALSLATLSLAALTSCGDDKTTLEPSTTAGATSIPAVASQAAATDPPGAVIVYTGDFASPYCKTARDWVAHEVQEFEPSPDPAVNRAYFVEYRAFVDKATAQAPEEIAADWTLFKATHAKLEAILEHYNFDGARIEAEATDEEKALLDAPPPAEQQAQENFHRYEAEVCHAGELVPAEVTYTGDADSEFCQLEDPSSATPPAELEEYFTSGAASRLADDRIAAAPPEIKSDVEIEEHWKVEQLPKVLAAHGWEVARALREGTEEELIAMTYAAPEVRDANARLGAFYEQVCEQ